MKQLPSLLVALVVALIGVTSLNSQINCQNNRVILGVLAQEWWHNTSNSYIAASYVKYVESAGARVVPIFINQPKEYYDNLMNKINGVLLPGGSNHLSESGYGKTASILLDKAIELNQKGVHFPVWGTCLGFQKMAEYFANTSKWKSKCMGKNLALSTNFKDLKAIKSSKLLSGAQHIVKILSTEKVNAHSHGFCLTEETFYHLKLDTHFSLLSYDLIDNVKTVSIIESKQFPFFATIFHPEKNLFEFVVTMTTGNINHGPNAVLVSQYFANFLVNEARKNDNNFADIKEEMEVLIYNYNDKLVYTGKGPYPYFVEIYQFSSTQPSKDDFNVILWLVFLCAIVVASLLTSYICL